MNFRVGDVVVHCTYGLGKVIQIEERTLYGPTLTYYAVQIGDLTIWVPEDEQLGTRLRPPTPDREFPRLLKILSGPGESLPADRHERKLLLINWLKDGRAESLCRVIRGLSNFRQVKSLNDYDQVVLRRTQQTLIGEWGYSLSITPAQAEYELHHLLSPKATRIEA
jgi:RNA polymerase-interacting CarD/CdnL/TRCF family regulator